MITAYTKTEVSFALPHYISEQDVVKAEFEVAGYYRRYGDVVIGLNVKPSSRPKGNQRMQ
jgi:hypothetical protein